MLATVLIGALSVSGVVQQTDTIVDANGASRMALESFQGQVVVRTWDREAVQVQAEHAGSMVIRIDRSGRTITVEPDAERGLGLLHDVDFHITVPRAFDLSLEGVALDVDIEGSEGQIEVGTVHGPIRVIGGRGSVHLESVNGEIHLEDARADMEVTGVAGGVTILNCAGDLYVESVGGELRLEGIASSDVEAGTVGGTLRYEGAIEDGGMYNFGSHGGSIWLYLPANMNAEVDAVTLAGDIEIDYPGAPSEPSRGGNIPGMNEKELSFQIGTGSASIEVESFGGTIRVLRQGG